jgi:hypothetical protein
MTRTLLFPSYPAERVGCSKQAQIAGTSTCSTASDLAPGNFVAAVGADNPEKPELHPSRDEVANESDGDHGATAAALGIFFCRFIW